MGGVAQIWTKFRVRFCPCSVGVHRLFAGEHVEFFISEPKPRSFVSVASLSLDGAFRLSKPKRGKRSGKVISSHKVHTMCQYPQV